MKKFYLLTKTLLVAVCLLVGASNAWAATETYDFSNYVATENLGYSTGRDLTLTGDNISTADASTVKLVSGVSSGTSFDFGGRFAVQSTTVKFRNGNSQSKATTYKVNKGIQYATNSGTNHFSILNLKKNDIVTITTGSGTTKFASTNAKVGGSQVTQNQRVGSDATTGDVGSTTVCTMTADGNLDLIMEGWAVIMSVTINNDTHSVEEGDIVSDGTTVNDVYGITMTYHGTWENNTTYATASTNANTTRTNNIPTEGDYIVFQPTVNGILTLDVNTFYAKKNYRLADESGHLLVNYTVGSSNWYGAKEFGSLEAGKTYYFYKTTDEYGYNFKSFKFTPSEEKTFNSYYVSKDEIVKSGDVINCVSGITMTYGGTDEASWEVGEDYSTPDAKHNDNASVTDNIPTANTFVIFNPSANGKLTMKYVAYPYNNRTSSLYLSDGTTVEKIDHVKDGNGVKTDEFATTLSAGTTYYVYFSGGNFASKICGFSFDAYPSTVSGTITPAGWSTFSSSYPLNLSAISGGEAYYASAANGETVTLTPTTATVPAGEGLMIKGTPNATFTINTAASGTAIEGNRLKATDGTEIAASPSSGAGTYHYVFGYKTSDATEYGFYNLAANTTVPAGKAYLEITSNGARALRISLGGITEVENVEAVPEAKAQEGKFIENGKLVIIKNGVKYNAAGAKLY